MSEPEMPLAPPGPTPEQIQRIADSADAFKASADQAHAELSQLRANNALANVMLQRAQQTVTVQTQVIAELRAKADALAVDKAGLEQKLSEQASGVEKLTKFIADRDIDFADLRRAKESLEIAIDARGELIEALVPDIQERILEVDGNLRVRALASGWVIGMNEKLAPPMPELGDTSPANA